MALLLLYVARSMMLITQIFLEDSLKYIMTKKRAASGSTELVTTMTSDDKH
jgi:hypothetical protein